MKLGKMSLAGAAALVAAGVVWVLTRPDPAETPQTPGGTAVVEQPSGRIVSGTGAESTHTPEADGKSSADGKTGVDDTHERDATAAVGGSDVKTAVDAKRDPDTSAAGDRLDGTPEPATGESARDSRPADGKGDAAGRKSDAAGQSTTVGRDGEGPAPGTSGLARTKDEEPADTPVTASGGEAPVAGESPVAKAETEGSLSPKAGEKTGNAVARENKGVEKPSSPDPGPAPAPADAGNTTPTKGDAGDGQGARVAAVDRDLDHPHESPTGKPAAGPEAASDGDSAEAPKPPSDDRADTAATTPAADPNTPTFDVVRIDPTGETVLAGRAAPNQRVEVTLDGEVVETVTTDGDGTFVAVLTTPLSGLPQQLQLRVPAPDVAGAEDGAPKRDGAATGETGGSAAGPSVAAAGDASAPPDVDVSAPALLRPELGNGGGVATGGSDSGVTRADGASGLSAPTGPTASGADRIARTVEARRDAAGHAPSPGRLSTAPKANGGLHAGAVEPTVSGVRTEPGTTVARPDTANEPDAPPEPDNVSPSPAPGTPTVTPSPDGVIGRPGGADRPLAGARNDPDGPAVAAVDGAPRTPEQVAGTRFLKSAPVIILPAEEPEEAPTVLKSTREDLKILQPSVSDINSVVLDRISYGETGDVILAGRGRAGRAVRVYGNGLIVGTTQIDGDGTWMLSVAPERGRAIKLLRMDELDGQGRVLTRVEAPFSYSRASPKLVRQREVTINKGDMLWRIAEQYYGEGLRFSVIYGANAKLIRDPDLIYPGQVFTVPELVDALPER